MFLLVVKAPRRWVSAKPVMLSEGTLAMKETIEINVTTAVGGYLCRRANDGEFPYLYAKDVSGRKNQERHLGLPERAGAAKLVLL